MSPMDDLVRRSVTPHPWRFHKWVYRDNGTVGPFGVVEQCTKCHLVRVTNMLSEQRWQGSHEILNQQIGSSSNDHLG